MLEKLKTKQGSTSIGLVMLFTGVIVFLCLPIFAVLVDRGLLRLASQEIIDQIDAEIFQLYHQIDMTQMSEKDLVISNELLSDMNGAFSFSNPVIESVDVTSMNVEKHENYEVSFVINMSLKPTLYREFYQLETMYQWVYTVYVPIN